MKNKIYIFSVLFLFSCVANEAVFIDKSNIEVEGNAEEILNQLNDPNLRKGKIFVFSNIKNGLTKMLRVNNTQVKIRDKEVQVFDLKNVQNSVFSFDKIFGTEVNNCRRLEGKEGDYIFDTNEFPTMETHYIIIYRIDSQLCARDIHVSEKVFFYIKENPRSKWNKSWIINKDL